MARMIKTIEAIMTFPVISVFLVGGAGNVGSSLVGSGKILNSLDPLVGF